MPYNRKKLQISYNYKKKNIKRVPLDMQNSDYENLKSAANDAGETVNGYIKKAISERMKREEQKKAGSYPKDNRP